MPRVLKIALFSMVGVVIIVTIVLIIATMTQSDTPTENANVNTTENTNADVPANTDTTSNSNATPSENVNSDVLQNTNQGGTQSDEKSIIRSNAHSFAQIFGSYSTHQPYANIESAKILMSKDLASWADGILNTRASNLPSKAYYGIETYALSTEITAFTAGESADVTVTTQRRESIGTTANKRTFVQKLLLTMVVESGVWKVDTATWEERGT